MSSSFTYWNWFAHASDIWGTRQLGPAAIEIASRSRLASLVRFARTHSSFYRDLYQDVPEHAISLDNLPVVTKDQLMQRFDDWVTDPAIKRADVDAFLADPNLIGGRYLQRYAVWKSSGSTGTPGVFIQDAHAISIYNALLATQLDTPKLAANYALGMLTAGGRSALIAATGAHFASIASWRGMFGDHSWMPARVFSVMTPLGLLVDQLNEYQPAFLASYPTVLALLAEEQRAGRLHIHPTTLWAGGECLTPMARTEIERVFRYSIIDEYGASECLSIAYGCREGWLHVNADWTILEPVNRNYERVPPGETSHTVLLTNLANRVQPVIRYDLGDSIILKPERCACGSSLPAIQVEGRHDDVLELCAQNGVKVRLLPMALSTVVEEASGVHRFQIVQSGPHWLKLRLDTNGNANRKAMGQSACAALRGYLTSQGLPSVRVTMDKQAPTVDVMSGKLRQIISA